MHGEAARRVVPEPERDERRRRARRVVNVGERGELGDHPRRDRAVGKGLAAVAEPGDVQGARLEASLQDLGVREE